MGLLLLDCANQDRVLFYDELFLERWQFMSKREKRRNRIYKSILDSPFSDIKVLDTLKDVQAQILEQFGNFEVARNSDDTPMDLADAFMLCDEMQPHGVERFCSASMTVPLPDFGGKSS